MHRTMIYIGENEHSLLLKTAKLTGRSLSQLIREAVQYYLNKVVKRPAWESDPLWDLEGKAEADQTNADSLDHDQILYGSKT